MTSTLILSHGRLAHELLDAARVIAGELADFEALSLGWQDSFEEAREKTRLALERLDRGNGVLVLTDMFGGTPYNVAMTFMGVRDIEVVAGVNLPMVVRLACRVSGEMTLPELAEWIEGRGKDSICRCAERPGGLREEVPASEPAGGS